MMAGNPNWWSMNDMQSHQRSSSSQLINYVSTNNSTLISSNPSPSTDHHRHSNGQDLPVVRSWSQLLLGGEEERFGASIFQQQKKLENWEDQVLLNLSPISNFTRVNNNPNVKQESNSQYCSSQVYGHLDDDDDDQFQGNNIKSSNSFTNYWPNSCQQVMPVSSPTSCITTLSNNNNNFLNFSGRKSATKIQRHNQDHSSECNSTGTGGASKKARVTQSSAQPALKVRKEKLGDRITALHQIVSPFGKTDTASVLSEAIGYIRFLQSQIEALSSPYMRNSGSTGHHQHSVQERNCLFPEEAGQFLNDIGMEGRGASKQDLRSRGLCLVPISCTQHVGNDNAADYWAPAALGGGGF